MPMRKPEFKVMDQLEKISGNLLNAGTSSHDWHLGNRGFPATVAGTFVKMASSESNRERFVSVIRNKCTNIFIEILLLSMQT